MKKEHTNNAPLISIITPLFNAEKYIAQTLESVLHQTVEHWEHIIVDDASTDASTAIVTQWADKDPRIKLFKLTHNQGAAACRNKATLEAQGAFIAFLDSDDLWHPQKLERQLAFMQANRCEVSYTSYLHIDEAGKPLGKRVKALSELTYAKQHRNNYIGNLTGMYMASKIGKVIAPSIRKRQDWAVWLEAIKRSNKPALGIQEDLAYYRVRKNSISSNKFNLIPYNYKFYRQHLGYSRVSATLHLLRFFWEYFLIRPKQIEIY